MDNAHKPAGTSLQSLLPLLRDGGFLTRSRMQAWAILLLAGYLTAIVFLIFTAHGLNDYQGRPLGTDFSDIYAAGVSAMHGHADAPFDILQQHQQEQALFGADTPTYGWHYPPFFLLVATPLAHLPYIVALIFWQISTLLAYLAALRLLLRGAAPPLSAGGLWALLALAFTAVFVNLTHGQNGFLTTAIFTTALALLDRRPVLSGALFGLLCYKPQFAIVLPLIMVATGRWRPLAPSALMVAALAVVVTLLFGWAVWPAFLQGTHFTRTVVLENGSAGFYKIQSIFAWVRLSGGTVAQAYVIQTATDVVIVLALLSIWRSHVDMAIKGAALCLGALLVTPYVLDYDLMLLAPAIALLAADSAMKGMPPYRGLLIAALWIVPFAARPFAQATGQPLAVPLMLLTLFSLYCQATRVSTRSASVLASPV